MEVALVHPPFAPAGLASLGLSLLQAGLAGKGVPCRTFYWGLEMLAEMPGRGRERVEAYRALTSRRHHPFNEWIFARALHGSELDEHDAEVRQAFLTRRGDGPDALALARNSLALRERAPELVDAMAERLARFDVVGISSTFFQNVPALALAKRLKRRWPEKLVVLGGANTDGGMGRALLELYPFVDAVFEGEADHAFPAWVERLRDGSGPENVPGLIRREAGSIVDGPPARPLADLDALPLPDFGDYVETFRALGLPRDQELTLPLESSRGCWWGERQHCTFCGLNADGMQYRAKSPDRFMGEVDAVVDRYGARFLFMTDNILSPRYDERFDAWARRRGVKVDFFYEVKANVRRSQLVRLAESGVTAVQPGIESFSRRVLDLMRKGTTPIQNVALLKHARELGILVAYNILVGIPGERADDYEELLELLPKISHLRPPAAVAPVEFHRFSPYERDPGAWGLELQPLRDYAWLHPFPTPELARLAYFFEDPGRPAAPPWTRDVSRAVLDWARAYDEEECALSQWERGEDVLIEDRRPAFGPRSFRLQAFAGEVVRALAETDTLSSLVRRAERSDGPSPGGDALPGETAIAFDAATFAADPEACLSPLLEAALVVEERRAGAGADRRLLALPVPEPRHPVRDGWTRTGA